MANPTIRNTFFSLYPEVVDTELYVLPSASKKGGICGACHYNFTGGGPPWNPYGELVRSNILNNGLTAEQAILAAESKDPDKDGFASGVEITNTLYENWPTFPGLSPANLGLVDTSTVDVADIQDHLVPSSGVDTSPPTVAILHPNGGETLTANVATNIIWTSHDDSGVAGVSIYLSLDNGTNYSPIAFGVPSPAATNSYMWFPANRPSSNALIRIVAVDNASNLATNESASVFTMVSPSGGLVPTTLRDFDMPGSQPHELTTSLIPPSDCALCHGNYNTNHEPYFSWRGSMMANASIDPLFEANLAIANQDAPDSGDLCLRCHMHAGWVEGRSVPTSGEAMLDSDKFGVSCALCHRMIDPIYEEGVSPFEDQAILAAMLNPGTNFGSGMVHLDPTDIRRGPFADATNDAHAVLVSPFHREAALCGTCHDVSNPAFERQPDGSYAPNELDAPATDFSSEVLGPVERTYSEWLHSDFNSSTGVELPEFAGNKTNGLVATCQDCHLRDIEGYGCDTNQYPTVPLRADLPLHDMTGGSTWLPGLLAQLHPSMDSNATAAGVLRATYMLQNAADLAVGDAGSQMQVTVTNNCGHKLPTGYPEGRRIWLNVQFYDVNSNMISESGAYTSTNGVLSHDEEVKIYEVHPGIDTNISGVVGLPAGPSLHFVLNNKIYEDNRIPPRGFTNATYATFGGAPVGYSYADGQYWDHTLYNIPDGAKTAEVKLYYQSTSKEFVEFLYTNNFSNNKGQIMYDLWSTNGMCPPTLMREATWYNPFLLASTRYADGVFHVDFHCRPGTDYTIEYTDTLNPPLTWHEFQANGTRTATEDTISFEDDFTNDTSTNLPPANGMRFYRFRYE